MSEEVVTKIWKRGLAWSRAADKLKARVVYARISALALSASGAVLETVAATLLAEQPDARTWCAAVGAVLLAIATFVTARLLTVDAVRAWTRLRSVSEAIKAEVYIFRAKAAPYIEDDALDKLRDKTNETQAAAQDLERHVAGMVVGAEAPPPMLTHDDYIAGRVEQQIEGFYRKKATQYAHRLTALRAGEFVLGLAGTTLGALAAVISSHETSPSASDAGIGAWVAVLTTLGAALAAHIAANRYDFLVVSYYGTARRLEDLVIKWRSHPDTGGADAWSTFVNACEDAISVESESWVAKWMEKEPGTA
ncbi:MAG TPA: DUF4231 domain-containing protein [Dongiaceae bacterium]|nr:DUF4231 domain-containing protein [Dongiaceae bacterium]